jgi:hypothetical protein
MTAYGEKNGVTFSGETKTWSIKEGIMSRLDKYYPYVNKAEVYKKLCTLLVDMLYYGAEAEAVFNTDSTSRVTDGLAQKYVDLKTTTEPVISATNSDVSTTKDRLYEVNLGIQDAVEIQLTFRLATDDYSQYVVKVTASGTTYEFTGEDFIPLGEGAAAKFVVVIFNKLNATNMRDVTSVELWRNGAQVGGSYTVSIEGFATNYIAANNYVDLLKAMMIYGDSAKNYLG